MNESLERRFFLKSAGKAAIAGAVATSGLLGTPGSAAPDHHEPMHRGRIFKSIKFQMFGESISMEEKFRLLKDMGYDGVELNSPGGENKAEALAASQKVGLPLHGVVDTVHWGTRLSDPDPAVREKGLQALLTAISETQMVGGSSVLLVPGRVMEGANQDQVWHRSIEQIRKALPTAAKAGVHILIENVWNGFCYEHNGPENQTADLLAHYLDTINSPWVGSYFDIGNHQKYGKPAHWIRRLGKRIVKLDVKDWGKKNGFCKIGDGDVDWADVRLALKQIGYTGWCTAEVGGGDRKRMKDIAERMDRVLGL